LNSESNEFIPRFYPRPQLDPKRKILILAFMAIVLGK